MGKGLQKCCIFANWIIYAGLVIKSHFGGVDIEVIHD